MTMTDRPIPADLMDHQPVPAEQLDLFARLAQAFPGSAAELVEAAAALTPEEVEVHRAGHEASTAMLAPGAAGKDVWRTPAAQLAHQAPEVVRFAVADKMTAEWTLRKMAATERERAEARELAAQWRAEVDRFERETLAPLDRTYSFFEGHAEAYMRTVREESNGATKSIKLVAGTLKSTGSTKPKPAIEDQAALLEWAHGLPPTILEGDLTPIKRTEEVQISRLAKLVTVHEIPEPIVEEGPDGEAVTTGYSTRRFVTLALNPETGEAWPEDFDPAAHAIPGARVEIPTVSYKVEPR